MDIHIALHDFKNELSCETGCREPLAKIVVSEKVWNKILSQYHDKANMVVDGTEISTMQLVGVEIVKQSKVL
jgi:hypothetical protein